MLSQLSYSKLINGAPIMETIIFVSYILICAALFKSRFSRSVTVSALTAAGIVIMGVNIAVMLSSMENLDLMLTLLPLTAYLPFSVLLYFLSDGGIFETTAVCAVGTLEVLILKSLQKILTKIFFVKIDMEIQWYVPSIIIIAVIAITTAVLVFVTFRFIVKPFRLCVAENSLNRRNRLLLLVPTAVI